MTVSKVHKRKRVQLDFDYNGDGRSLTQQHQKDAVNVNSIMQKYRVTGLARQRATPLQFGDYSNAVDYHTALNNVQLANEMFMMLPAQLRGRFQNDPGKFLDYYNDPSNTVELVNMGVMDKSALESNDSESAGDQPAQSERIPT